MRLSRLGWPGGGTDGSWVGQRPGHIRRRRTLHRWTSWPRPARGWSTGCGTRSAATASS